MMIIPNPRESAQGANHDGDVGYDADNEDGIVANSHVLEVPDNFEEEPRDT